jgi:hypothetical protein
MRASAADEAIVPARRIDLFNGKDFSGLAFCMKDNADPTNTWSIHDGVIHCTGKPNGYLRTDKSYRDYKLTVDWRFVKIGPGADNSGVLVHMQSPDTVWPPCIQSQGKHDKQGDLLFMSGAEGKEHRGMNANTPVPKRGESNEKPVGEWNRCELICSGNSLKNFINGKLMNEATECTVSSGWIGMQCEGAELEIRTMYLEPLKAQ